MDEVRISEQDTSTKPAKRADLFSLIAGLIALVCAIYMLTDGEIWPDFIDLRWILAAIAIAVGIILLVNSARRSDN